MRRPLFLIAGFVAGALVAWLAVVYFFDVHISWQGSYGAFVTAYRKVYWGLPGGEGRLNAGLPTWYLSVAFAVVAIAMFLLGRKRATRP